MRAGPMFQFSVMESLKFQPLRKMEGEQRGEEKGWRRDSQKNAAQKCLKTDNNPKNLNHPLLLS